MSRITDLKKKLSAMKIKGSRAITLDIDYISDLISEIDELESAGNQGVSEREEKISSKNEKIVLHGGKFK
jgi:hypothetical protein